MFNLIRFNRSPFQGSAFMSSVNIYSPGGSRSTPLFLAWSESSSVFGSSVFSLKKTIFSFHCMQNNNNNNNSDDPDGESVCMFLAAV